MREVAAKLCVASMLKREKRRHSAVVVPSWFPEWMAADALAAIRFPFLRRAPQQATAYEESAVDVVVRVDTKQMPPTNLDIESKSASVEEGGTDIVAINETSTGSSDGWKLLRGTRIQAALPSSSSEDFGTSIYPTEFQSQPSLVPDHSNKAPESSLMSQRSGLSEQRLPDTLVEGPPDQELDSANARQEALQSPKPPLPEVGEPVEEESERLVEVSAILLKPSESARLKSLGQVVRLEASSCDDSALAFASGPKEASSSTSTATHTHKEWPLPEDATGRAQAALRI